ncbi:hypothetical protein B0I32_13177 [Nonomuraea fuscirosea]|uniref:Uncharacterized protein n=1 Tax=Nonomuraea fuscirosea TaxID=1291556 RepID=A0A2T0M5I1_9ACTN|nr:hypothetical protein [Nonomuraea fuscirosea]PRX52680.1 hypothetical protein B0I32_13177 [Nonomuraea fuscirosea]
MRTSSVSGGIVLMALTAVLAALPTAGCGPAPVTGPQPARLLAVSHGGAVLYAPETGLLTGYGRSGTQVWQDRDAAAYGVEVTCLAECPDAVVSQIPTEEAPPLRPFLLSGTGRAPFPVSPAAHAHVLSARSAGDAVVEETDDAGRTWIRVVRPDGSERLPVTHRGFRWVESTDGTAAFAYPWKTGAPQDHLLRFARDANGWRRTERGPSLAETCVAVAIALKGECVTGGRAAAVVTRTATIGGRFHTTVTGLRADGGTAWRRDFVAETGVTAHPSDDVIGFADGGTFTALDTAGDIAWTKDGVLTARFTAGGELVTLTQNGRVEWHPAGTN